MPKFIGTAGDFLKERAFNRRLNVILFFFISWSAVVFFLGWASGFAWEQRTLWSLLCLPLVAAITFPSLKLFEKLFDKQLRLARLDEDGADGEREFLRFLRDLPDTYTVINNLDFADSYGNIDHLIVGPNGIFAIDVKNWRGTVTPDGKGEILLNGRPTNKPQVRYFTRRTMDLKDRLKALTKLDPYVQCVFAFLRTHVQAKWGTTAAIHCIRADKISSYITNFRPANLVSPPDIERLVKAAEALQSLAPSNGHRQNGNTKKTS